MRTVEVMCCGGDDAWCLHEPGTGPTVLINTTSCHHTPGPNHLYSECLASVMLYSRGP